MSLLPEFLRFDEAAHRYFSPSGQEYLSVSKILHHIEKPFDAERISYFSARKQLRTEQRTDITGVDPSEQDIRFRQKVLQAQWKQKNKESTDVGTLIHNCIEHRAKTGLPSGNATYDPMAEAVHREFLADYKEFYAEERVYSLAFNVGGTADFLGVRGVKDWKKVIDIVDYKTNASKGIEYRSEYGNRYLDPVSHLEQCSYNHYCFQQSIYARFLEEHGFTIGQIRLIYIPPADPMKYFAIPVPYMKREAEAILLHLGHTKVLHSSQGQTIRV